MARMLPLIAAAILLAACAHVQSTVTVFPTLPQQAEGRTIAIISLDPKNSGSLEFRSYADKLAAHLQMAGWLSRGPYAARHERRLHRNIRLWHRRWDARYQCLLDSSVRRYRVQGATTTGTVSTFGNTSTVQANTTFDPVYGVTGYATGTVTNRVFQRAVVLGIFDRSKINLTDPNSLTAAQVYDAKLRSAGTCGSIAGVIDPILTAMFEDFSGKNGQTRTVNVRWDSQSC